eukprot:g26006.t1
MAGPHTPFRIELYRQALDILHGCMTCLNLVIISEKIWVVLLRQQNQTVREADEENAENDDYSLGGTPVAFSNAENHSVLKIATESMPSSAILRHRIEAKLENQSVVELNNMKLVDQHFTFEKLDKWLSQVHYQTRHIRTDKNELTNNLQARLVVGMRAIAQLHHRLAALHSLCLKANVL